MYHRLLSDDGEAESEVAPDRRGWDATPDLERFLASFYRYFEVGGLRGIVAIHLSQLVALAFTICFSFVLLFIIDWQALLACDSEDACRNVPLFRRRPLGDLGLLRFAVLVSFLLFTAYWVCTAVAAVQHIGDAVRMSTYYKERLGIYSDDVLRATPWSEVVLGLIEQQKASPFCIVQESLTALEVANIIMREDNFMVAFANHNTFVARLPRWVPPRLLYTRAVLWNLRFAIFRGLFDHRSRVRADFLSQPELLVRRFRWMGVLNLLLALPVLIFVTIYFFMRHAEEFRSHRSSPLERQWTDFAQWTFREYNELPHQFHARLQLARGAAEAFTASARPAAPMLNALQRCVKFIAGSILAVLLGVALWDEALLFVKVQDKNLLWYLGFFGFIFAVADNAEASSGYSVAGGGGGSGVWRPSAAAPTQAIARGTPPTAATAFAATGVGGVGVGATGGAVGGGSGAAVAAVLGTPLHMHATLMQLVRCTHHLPPAWRAPAQLQSAAVQQRPAVRWSASGLRRGSLGGGGGSASAGRQQAEACRHFARVRSEFLRSFFVHRIQVLAEELLGVVLTPVLLMVYLPTVATDIVELVYRVRHASPNLGDWCTFGCLDPARNGSEFYGGGHEGGFGFGSELRGAGGVEAFDDEGAVSSSSHIAYFDEETPWDGGSCRDIIVSNGGKLEKSVISFLHGHRISNGGAADDSSGGPLNAVYDSGPAVAPAEADPASACWARWPTEPAPVPLTPRADVTRPSAASESFDPDAEEASSNCGGMQELVEWHAEEPPTPESSPSLPSAASAPPAPCAAGAAPAGLAAAGASAAAAYRAASAAAAAAPPPRREAGQEQFHSCPSSALRFLRRLEAFGRGEARAASPCGDLLQAPLVSFGVQIGDEEAEAAGCGAHFGWIEALHEHLRGGGSLL